MIRTHRNLINDVAIDVRNAVARLFAGDLPSRLHTGAPQYQRRLTCRVKRRWGLRYSPSLGLKSMIV